jgi:hypothetical protein
MKKILIIMMIKSLFVHVLSGQSLVQQIHEAYNALDSVMYIKDIIQSYKVDDENRYREAEENFFSLKLSMVDLNNKDSIQRKIITDGLYREHFNERRKWREERVKKFASSVKDEPVQYVLNLIVDGQTLKVDTGKLAFNLFYFDKDFKGRMYVYIEDGRYSWHDARYRTFSRELGTNAPIVFRRIMRKRPQYLLYCEGLEGMNTILYMKDDKIFVYRIVQMKEYELNDYIKKFKP